MNTDTTKLGEFVEDKDGRLFFVSKERLEKDGFQPIPLKKSLVFKLGMVAGVFTALIGLVCLVVFPMIFVGGVLVIVVTAGIRKVLR